MKYFITFAITAFLLTACAYNDIKAVNYHSPETDNMQSEKQKNDNNSGTEKSEALNSAMDQIASTLFNVNEDDSDANLGMASLSDLIPLVKEGAIGKQEILNKLKAATKELDDKKAKINASLSEPGEFDNLDNETKARLVNSINNMLESIKTHINSAIKEIETKTLSQDETVALLEDLVEKSAETTMVAMQDLMEFIMEALAEAMQDAFGAIISTPSSDENNDDGVDANTNNDETKKLKERIFQSYYIDLSDNTFVLHEDYKNYKPAIELFQNNTFDGSKAIPYYGIMLKYDKTFNDLDSIIEIIAKEYFPNYLTEERMYYIIPMIDKSDNKSGIAQSRPISKEKKIYAVVPSENEVSIDDYTLTLSDELLVALQESSLDLSKIKSSLVNLYRINFAIFYDDRNTLATPLQPGDGYFCRGELYPITDIIRYFELQK